MTCAMLYNGKIEELQVSVYQTNLDMGMAAAEMAAGIIKRAVNEKNSANVILAAANSQLTFLESLKKKVDIDWSRVNFFHMDEYVGLDPSHPALFAQFLRRHFIDLVHPATFYTIDGQAEDIEKVCREYEHLMKVFPIDLCAMGIGENGHMAFNDPPYADFKDPRWVKPVQIDDISRRQQVNEGHFASLDLVPRQAITVTIPGLLSAKKALVIVPEKRKADAVYKALHGPITPSLPASILRKVSHAHLLLDRDAAGDSIDIK